ncbi:unnamed protein product [Rotaria sp. Silwood1]|nr:unnamed protein product [Rotaria sp. Silwood1]CAF0961601.1 unnamed protein product [Rotaria sp. Silwood1]CAF3404445.1 unnamed protein product [Rotaria sp. Silwood1]CAF4540421.1 unnamed protein product [Rotaria sp. Silwood1]CAF4563702.1 unnamed protein product [Rotaria sp. Silwood1]
MTTSSKSELPSPSTFEHVPHLVFQTGVTSDSFSLPTTTTNHRNSRTSIDVIREMACSSPVRQEYTNLTVLDVYDEAAIIGKDFERIIEAYGTETIRDLVPKVIHILELLELQAAKNEKETDKLMEMKVRIERLEMEKNETRELREKFNQELELIEEQWRKEADNLMGLVSKLEDENRRLRDELQNKNDLHEKSNLHSPTEIISITREELQCIKNLTDENMKLKRLLKTKDKELSQKTLDTEAIQGQLERVCKLNCTLRQKNTFSANQTQRLMVEKFDLEVQLKEKEHFINHMKDRVADELTSPTSPINPINDLTTLEANQPRFSLEELRQVLWERNDLKTKLMEVEEELRLFKEQEDDDNNGAVEGPIPLEPDEKLYGHKRDESKIRQFLRVLFPPTKQSSSLKKNTPIKLLATPSTRITSNVPVSRSYSTFSSPSVEPNLSSSQQISIGSLFNINRKMSETKIPLLSSASSK